MILEYKNIDIHYTTTGSGTTVILLHGFLENVDMWNDIGPELSKRHHVICMDLLGHGKTGCLGYVHTMDDMANAVLAVIKHLKIKQAKFIGHSMGGYVALALAEKYAKLFSGLCLMNSTFEADTEERKDLRTRAIKMAQTQYESLVRMSFANLFATESRTTCESEFNSALQVALETPLQGYIAAQEGMKLRPNRFKVFKDLEAKKLIITGKKEALINSEDIKTLIKDTDIAHHELAAGHMTHIGNKSELTYFLMHFVEK